MHPGCHLEWVTWRSCDELLPPSMGGMKMFPRVAKGDVGWVNWRCWHQFMNWWWWWWWIDVSTPALDSCHGWHVIGCYRLPWVVEDSMIRWSGQVSVGRCCVKYISKPTDAVSIWCRWKLASRSSFKSFITPSMKPNCGRCHAVALQAEDDEQWTSQMAPSFQNKIFTIQRIDSRPNV